jgi:hypothetical protein
VVKESKNQPKIQRPITSVFFFPLVVLSIMQQIPNSVGSSAMSTLSSSVVPIPPGQQQAPPSGASNISMKAMAPQQIPSSYTLQQQQQQKQTQMQSLPIRAYLDQTVVPLLLDGM